MNKIDFTFDGGYRGRWALSTELSLGLFGAFLLGISLAFEALEFLAHVAIVIGTALEVANKGLAVFGGYAYRVDVSAPGTGAVIRAGRLA